MNAKLDWSSLREEVFRDNLLKKKSNRWIGHLVQCFQRRYVARHGMLPDVANLSRYVSMLDSSSARIQVLYQYICESDSFVDLFVTDLVGDNLARYGAFRLTISVYDDFVARESQSHPEMKHWSRGTIKKIRSDLFAFLRSSGLMERHPSVTVRKFLIRPEPFAFLLYGLLSRNLDAETVLRSRLWNRYFLSRGEIEGLLAECQVRGWLQFRSLGSISELVLRFGSLEEWLDALE